MKIIPKGSKLYSIVNYKCPRCQEGEVFEDKNPYNLGKLFKMPEHCSHCGLRFQIEPSFFYGAMYVSYGLTVAVFVAVYLIMEMIYDPSVGDIIIAIALSLLVGSPIIFRMARIIWMNIFIKYAPEKRGANFK